MLYEFTAGRPTAEGARKEFRSCRSSGVPESSRNTVYRVESGEEYLSSDAAIFKAGPLNKFCNF